MPTEINHIEILAMPFFPYYQPLRHAHDLPILSLKDFKKFFRIWAKRMRQISKNPNAILVIARSRYSIEDTYVNPNLRDPKIEALERKLFSSTQRMLGDRLFVLARYGDTKAGRKLIDTAKQRIVRNGTELKELAEARGFTISKQASALSYGASIRADAKRNWSTCPGFELKTMLEEAGIKLNEEKMKVVRELSIPVDTFHRFEKRRKPPTPSWARKRLRHEHKPRKG